MKEDTFSKGLCRDKHSRDIQRILRKTDNHSPNGSLFMFFKQPERLYAAKHSWIRLSVAYINHISIILHAAENESIHR